MITVGTDFSGIGAPEQALKELGIEHKVLFSCDKDKYARQTYLANHESEIMYEDVTTRDNKKAPEVDLYCFGFPCQAFSIAGNRKGFDEVRGTLFFNSADYIREKRPKVFIAENVKGLLSHDKPKGSKSQYGKTFNTIIQLLAKSVNGQEPLFPFEDNLGYHVYYKVLNSKHYDVPQNRERVFIIGFREETSFNFPNSKTVTKRLSDILEPIVDEKYYLSDNMINAISKRLGKYSSLDPDIAQTIHTKEGVNAVGNYITGEVGLQKDFKETSVAKSIQSRDYKGMNNYGINIVITGEATPNSQAGKIYDPNGLMPTISAGTHGYALGYIQESAQKGNLIIIDNVIQLNSSNEFGNKPSQQNRVYDINGQEPTMDTRSDQKNVLVPYGNSQDQKINPINGISQTLSSGHYNQPKIVFTQRIRRLTPLECFRLQGFPDGFIKPCSDSQTYKQAGNSITINVLKAIFKNIKSIN